MATPVYFLLACSYSGSGIPFNPLSIHFAWYTVGFGLAPIYFGIKLLYSQTLAFSVVGVEGNDLSYGYFLCLIASLLLHAVLTAFKPEDKIPTDSRPVGPLSTLAVFALAVPVIVLPPDLIFSGGIGGVVKWGPYALLMLLALRRPRPRRFWLKILCGTAILISATVFSIQLTYKSFAILALVPVVTYMWRAHRRALLLVGPALASTYLLIVAPTINKSREFRELEGMERLTKSYNSYSLSEDAVEKQYSDLMGRVFDPFSVGFIVSQTANGGLQHGATMQNLAYGFIPRIIWPDKPNVTRGFWFSKYLGFADSEKDATTSTAMTNVGELYWNWGALGVVIGTCIVTGVYAGLWRIASKVGLKTLPGMTIYFIVTMSTVNPSEASTAIVTATILYLIIGSIVLPRAFWRYLIAENRSVTAQLIGSADGARSAGPSASDLRW